MSKFDAATAVEAMQFDFTKYGGIEGEIPEPTTGQMNDYMVGMRRIITEYRSLAGQVDQDKKPEDMTPEELGALMDSMDDTMAVATEFNEKTVALTAEFCSNMPDATMLAMLPMRVMRAFSKWLMSEINPKAQEEAGTAVVHSLPAPQDRRPATKNSRRAKK